MELLKSLRQKQEEIGQTITLLKNFGLINKLKIMSTCYQLKIIQ